MPKKVWLWSTAYVLCAVKIFFKENVQFIYEVWLETITYAALCSLIYQVVVFINDFSFYFGSRKYEKTSVLGYFVFIL